MPFYNGPLSGDGTTPVHIVYLVDISGSMEEDGKIVMVRKAMENALQELRPGDFFNILYFSDQVSPFARTMCPVSSNTLRAALGSLNVVEPQGATDLSNALDLAFRQQDVTHILILTDGEPTEGITDFDALAEFAQHHNSNNAHILTLGLNKDKVFKAEPLLRQLAADSHGTYHAIDVTQLNKTP
jgi:Ca-activated chloride channel family protein